MRDEIIECITEFWTMSVASKSYVTVENVREWAETQTWNRIGVPIAAQISEDINDR